jgi:hypothetical protein
VQLAGGDDEVDATEDFRPLDRDMEVMDLEQGRRGRRNSSSIGGHRSPWYSTWRY